MKQYFLSLIFLISVFVVQAQNKDLIITKSGFKIYCKIVADDSVSLSYNIENHNSTLEIKKLEVKEYYYNMVKEKPKRQAAPVSDRKVTELKRDFVLINGSMGIAAPLGEFANKDAMSETSGLANTGYLFQASAVFKITDNIGICAAYHHQRNKLDADVINQYVMYINSGIPFTTKSTHWIISGLYGGLYLEKQVNSVKGLSVFFSAMIGKPKYTSPSYVSSLAIPGFYFTAQQNSASTFSMGYMLGPGLFYKFSDELGLNFSVNYLGGNAHFTNVIYSNSSGLTGSTEFKQKFNSLNTQIGLVICVGN